MRTKQTTIFVVTTVLLFTLAGCGDDVDGDGKLDLKEPMKPLSEMTPGMNWTINGPVDQEGNPVAPEETK